MKLPQIHLILAVSLLFANVQQALSYNADWQLVFNDEFAESSFNAGNLNWNDKWNKIDYVNWSSVSDWRKYQSRDDALVTQGLNGTTDYVTLKGTYGDYTSQNNQAGNADTFAAGGIFTNQTFSFQYGYMEVRAQFESANGCWPAIWLMPVSSTGWLPGGEIDIMEHINNENVVHQTLHLHNNSGTADAAPSAQAPINNTNGWHTYGLEWTPDNITFFVDGKATKTLSASAFTHWPFSNENHEFYILIDQQIGGSWAGEANAGALSQDSVDFNIDYVRVYSTGETSDTLIQNNWDETTRTPIDEDGNIITYTTATNQSGGILDQTTPGNYHFTIKEPISHILAEQGHIKLSTEHGENTISMDNAMIQAQSLYVAEGKYTLDGSAAADVNTLYVAGGSLEIDAPYALSSVRQVFLGMETDAITNFAQRNAALYFTTNQHISANITLVDDSKIAIYQGNTLRISGNVQGNAHTLNLVGVNSDGTAHMVLAGQNNKINRLTMGIAETTPAGNTFYGAGQILSLQLATGSNTEINTLLTHSPVADTPSSLIIRSGATLTVSDTWQHRENSPFLLQIDQGGVFNIGHANTQDSGVTISGSGTIRQIQNKQSAITTSTDFNGHIETQAGELLVSGSSFLTEAAAIGGGLTFLHVNEGMTIHTLRVYEGNSLGAYTGASADSLFESHITITETLEAGHGNLNAHLVLEDGVLLNITDERGIIMGSSITLSGKAKLGNTIISALQESDFESFTLATSLDAFITDNTAWNLAQSANAAEYFTADGIDLTQYTLHYDEDDPTNTSGGMLRITKNIPEPSSGILSSLALAALTLHRRRK